MDINAKFILQQSNWNYKILHVFRYLRAQEPYSPPENVEGIVGKLQANANLTTGIGKSEFNLEEKYNFLLMCAEEFQRAVPNSVLHEMNSISESRPYKFVINTHFISKYFLFLCLLIFRWCYWVL